MAHERRLPTRTNPRLEPDKILPTEELLERRKLGRTQLEVKPGQIGTSNATKPDNLGVFDYAHLRVPLPRDLRGSGVFPMHSSGKQPESYFLMRRCSDGFLSATGMFKAAYPWATKVDEDVEREFVKRSGFSDPREIAGNIWVKPEFALELACDYHIEPWILALLDPAPITNPSAQGITSPPKFISPSFHPSSRTLSNMAPPAKKDLDNESVASLPRSTRKRTVSREVRSTSPAKAQPPEPQSSKRTKATPRKRGRKTAADVVDGEKKGSTRARRNAANATPSVADSTVDSSSEIIEDQDAAAAATAIATVAEAATEQAAADVAEQVVAEAEAEAKDALKKDTARVTVSEDVEEDVDGVETKRTSIQVEMPADTPEQPLPASPEEALKQAKAIVSEAKELKQGSGTSGRAAGKKRKAGEMETQSPEEEIVQEIVGGDVEGELQQGVNGVAQEKGGVGIMEGTGDMVEFQGERTNVNGEPPTKRTRVMVPAADFRKQKMQKRALMGLSATLAVGAMIPFVSNLF